MSEIQQTEKELRKAFEETTTRNLTAVVTHTNNTRELVRTLEEEITTLKNMVVTYTDQINQLKMQVSKLQQKAYAGGTV